MATASDTRFVPIRRGGPVAWCLAAIATGLLARVALSLIAL